MADQKRALIFGVTGQDGSYLADILVGKGYEVWGTHRSTSLPNLTRIKHFTKTGSPNIHLAKCDVTDYSSIQRVITSHVRWDQCYFMCDQDHVLWSYLIPHVSINVTAGGLANVLEVFKNECPGTNIFVPTSATMFGGEQYPQCEDTPFNPLSPYACAKAHAHYLARYYRQVHGLSVYVGIMYNHDSVRRNNDYLLQKIYRAVYQTAKGNPTKVILGNLDTVVDIGYAREYMAGVVKFLETCAPSEMIFSSDDPITIDEIVKIACRQMDVNPDDVVTIDEFYSNRKQPITLVGDCSLATNRIGWNPIYSARNMLPLFLSQEVEWNVYQGLS